MKKLQAILSSKRGRIGFTIVALVLAVILLSIVNKCHAEGIGISVTKEVTHDESTLAGFLDYTAPSWSAYVGQWDSARFRTARNMHAVGAEYRTHLGPVYAGLGAVYLNQLTPLNGTRPNFSFTVGMRLWSATVFCRHMSHASILGIAPDKPNGGWNWCGGRIEF